MTHAGMWNWSDWSGDVPGLANGGPLQLSPAWLGKKSEHARMSGKERGLQKAKRNKSQVANLSKDSVGILCYSSNFLKSEIVSKL